MEMKRMVIRAAMAGVMVLAATGAGAQQSTNLSELVNRTTEHPRLLWKKGGEAEVRAKIAADPLLKDTYEAVRLVADHMLTEKPVVYRKDGRRLLGRSREALDRIMHLSFMARMTGERRYVERAMKEMQAAAEFPDWNPSHFLDTAEMTLALSIGLDWLYPELTSTERATVRDAIEEKGLFPYLKPGARHGWEKGGNNWNQVCHAGMLAGALALMERDTGRAADVVQRALNGLPNAMKVYIPDGTYPEGPGYWNYGTTFNVVIIGLLQTALGTDFGLSEREGFLKSGEFPLQMTGPTLEYFAFSDCGRSGGYSPAMAWFAAHTERPELMWFEARRLAEDIADVRQRKGARSPDRFFPMTLVWMEEGLTSRPPVPTAWLGRGPNPLAVFRSSWTDPNAMYVAVKAGSPGESHGHMDIGTFVFDADGVRWALDLGMQDYNKMEQRGLDIWNNRPGSDRWKIFRYHNRAHSTLLVDNQEQVVSSRAALVDFTDEEGKRGVTVDMDATYGGQLGGAKRRFSFDPKIGLTIEDRLTGGTMPRKVRWAMVTPASFAKAADGSAQLTKDGKVLRLAAAGPVEWREYPADPPPNEWDEPNPGIRLVGFERTLPAGATETWRVTLQPGTGAN